MSNELSEIGVAWFVFRLKVYGLRRAYHATEIQLKRAQAVRQISLQIPRHFLMY
jgi:hypothetical protein